MAQSDDGSLIEQGTPLTRNHWFDGKFLRADDLARDQDYHRAALRLANQAGGFGVVHGLELGLAGNEILLQPGLGLNADGDLLLLNSELAVGVEALIAASESAAAAPGASPEGNAHFAACDAEVQPAEPAPAAGGLRAYWLTLSPHQALCGHEDVVGALCERTCVTERQRPYRLEGVRLRARRIAIQLPALPGLEAGGRHARSRIASLLFGRDDARIAPLPDNGGRLLSPLWCSGAELLNGRELRLGLLVRGAGTADFIDLWTARRERMASQAEGYWRRRTRQRPYADFVAQVAQFQCQLYNLFRDAPPPGEDGGDCGALKALVADLERQLEAAQREDEEEGRRAAAAIDWERAASVKVMRRIGQFVLQAQPLLQARADRLLLERGIVELPPAGFLPVSPNGGPLERQLQAWVGPGLRLQICSAPLDAIGHLFGEAQHSARTSLTRGIADPADKPLLQIIVPDGEAQAGSATAPGYAIAVHADLAVMLVALTRLLAAPAEAPPAVAVPPGVRPPINAFQPAAGETMVNLGARLDSAFAGEDENLAEGAGRVLAGNKPGFAMAARGRAVPAGTSAASEDIAGVWAEAGCASDPFAAAPGASVPLLLDLNEADQPGLELPAGARIGIAMRLRAQLQLESDPAKVEAARAEVEQFTGVTGGELRLAALQDGELRYVRHLQGTLGGNDGAGEEVVLRFAASVLVLQRVGQHVLAALPVGKLGLLIFEYKPQAGGASRLQLRIVSFAEQQPGGGLSNHGFGGGALVAAGEQVHALATLRADAQALAAGAAPRVAAEAGLERLAAANVGIAAAARERLFAALASPPPSLRAQHDWVLFRRPVDARCTVQAAPPPVVVEPPTAPPKLTRYQAIVLRVNPVAGVDHVQIALANLRRGELPNLRVSGAASAGEISYLGDAELPQASNAYLVAQFGRARFAPPVVGAFVAAAPGVAQALEQRRFAQLADRLGGGAVQVEHLQGRPAALPASEAEGTLIYLINPDSLPPPPAEPVINHRHRVLLLRQAGVGVLTQLLGASQFATNAPQMLARLEAVSRGYFEVDYVLDANRVVVIDSAGSGYNSLRAAVDANSGLGSDQIPVLLRATDNSSGARMDAFRAATALFEKLFGQGGAEVSPINCNPSPTQLQAQYHALTLLFTKA